MVPSFCTSCSDMIERWKDLVLDGAAVVLDVWIDLKNMAAGVISRTAFGSSHNENKRIFEPQEQQLELVMLAHKLPHNPRFRRIVFRCGLRSQNTTRYAFLALLSRRNIPYFIS
ncbi:uncharacterized protein A4U43_C03F2470 [Asparagus officinalis]|uniref:Uncharacterized protein n=1 Tax=Asparagus officinalis TaxID=4686 RepID=A0A5P1FBZ1_ASPOF|nr:uncharacterized protein A4U43_C03F2470 [Asparagus officinalis]